MNCPEHCVHVFGSRPRERTRDLPIRFAEMCRPSPAGESPGTTTGSCACGRSHSTTRTFTSGRSDRGREFSPRFSSPARYSVFGFTNFRVSSLTRSRDVGRRPRSGRKPGLLESGQGSGLTKNHSPSNPPPGGGPPTAVLTGQRSIFHITRRARSVVGIRDRPARLQHAGAVQSRIQGKQPAATALSCHRCDPVLVRRMTAF